MPRGRPAKVVSKEVEEAIDNGQVTDSEIIETEEIIDNVVDEIAVEEEENEEETPAVQKKKALGRGIMTEKKLENLAKARAAKKQQLKKYSQAQRETAEKQTEEFFEEKMKTLVEQRVKEALKRKDITESPEKKSAMPKKPAKSLSGSTKAPVKKAPVKKPVKKVKRKVVIEEESDEDYGDSNPSYPVDNDWGIF